MSSNALAESIAASPTHEVVSISESVEEENNADLDEEEVSSSLVGQTSLLTREEEVRLARLIHAGGPGADAALTHFVAANQGLVRSIAKRYLGQGLDWEDLEQEGNIGLLRAIEKFDPDRGNKFSTIGVWWIRQAIARAVTDMGAAIRLPAYLHTAHMRIKRAEAQCMEEQDLLSDEDLLEISGLSPEVLSGLRQATGTLVSLSELRGDNEEQERGDLLADPTTSNLEEDTLTGIFSQELQQVVKAALTPEEFLIIRRRFGLQQSEEQTLLQVGQLLGISRERVRQKEQRALLKLRNAPSIRELCLQA